MNNLHLILGGPGCGKTTRLLNIVAEELSNGVPASQIAFVAFTKAAAGEAAQKASDKFSLVPSDLPWFRTIHSLAYGTLNVGRDEMMTPRDWQEFARVVGEPMGGWSDMTEAPMMGGSRHMGDLLLRITDYAATTMQPLDESWRRMNEVVDWYRLRRFSEALSGYKDDTGKMDFTDLLLRYAQHGKPLDVRVAVIDEAQDLTAAQWAVVRRAFQHVERVYVGGDDDQAIYHWAGADVNQFLRLSQTPEVLHESHRLPRQIHALSQRIASRISTRYEKRFEASPRDGNVTWHQAPDYVDLSHGSWFLLARNTYMLAALEEHTRSCGYNYTRRMGPAVSPVDVRTMQLWERLRTGKLPDCSAREVRDLAKAFDQPRPQLRELARYTMDSFDWLSTARSKPWHEVLVGIPNERREFYLACMRRGEKLTVAPRIRIETIHGVKGLEADHVLLMTDLSHHTALTYRALPDAEHRVFYVGATRAKESLHLVSPQSDLSYPVEM